MTIVLALFTTTNREIKPQRQIWLNDVFETRKKEVLIVNKLDHLLYAHYSHTRQVIPN